jgi:hypothetical protein
MVQDPPEKQAKSQQNKKPDQDTNSTGALRCGQLVIRPDVWISRARLRLVVSVSGVANVVLHQLTWHPLQSLLLLLPLRPWRSGLCSSRFASQAKLGKGDSWMGNGTGQMLLEQSMA